MTDRISFELNGETVEASADETIWQVADRLGIEIPHLCWQPEKDYRADGNCRACMVEVEGERTHSIMRPHTDARHEGADGKRTGEKVT